MPAPDEAWLAEPSRQGSELGSSEAAGGADRRVLGITGGTAIVGGSAGDLLGPHEIEAVGALGFDAAVTRHFSRVPPRRRRTLGLLSLAG